MTPAAPLFLLDPKSKRLLSGPRPPPRNLRNAVVYSISATLAGLVLTAGFGSVFWALQEGPLLSPDRLMGLLFGLPGLILLVLTLRHGWTCFTRDFPAALQRDLLEEHGRVLEGEVLECTGGVAQRKRFLVTVRYGFEAPGGRELSDEARHVRNDLRAARLPEPGTPVAILYYDEGNYRLL